MSQPLSQPRTHANDSRQWVYPFGAGVKSGIALEDPKALRALLGGKGAGLAEMSGLGLPVPPGFTITTEVCAWFYDKERSYPATLRAQVEAALKQLEQATGNVFGDHYNPLLVSVRSGARASMPGMMDTVLNLGLNTQTVKGLAEQSRNARFAYDSYRRFIQMYGNVVLGVTHHRFEDILEDHKRRLTKNTDTALTAEDWQVIIADYLGMVKAETGKPFPEDVGEQLWGAIGAVFGSWMNARAITYRRLHDIPADWGTAVNVQAMVFGNRGEDCATGVAFTRNPSTGANEFYGEYLLNAQGEDVVAGIRTPLPIAGMNDTLPGVYKQLLEVRQKLERHYRDMQDIEFTVQQGRLYMLQTRNGKRTGPAALRIATDLVKEKIITEREAISRIDPQTLDQLLHPTLDPKAVRDIVGHGLPASPGAAAGIVVFTAEEAEDLAAKGHAVILCRAETSPEDIAGMHAAKGILTTRGGMTSHAAVVARGMGRPCVVGAGELRIDARSRTIATQKLTLKAGDLITIDGGTGEIMKGEVPMVQPELTGDFAALMLWADKARSLGVRANADTPRDAATARKFGAEGIGLCRTEHMFFDENRILAVREMILATTLEEREQALAKLEPMQRADFVAIFEIMEGLPVTIRLLDPPLHEFLPRSAADIAALAGITGLAASVIEARTENLQEANPMLGHRGCRLGIVWPEIYKMQARAIFAAALEVRAKTGKTVTPEIMIPLVLDLKELAILKAQIDEVAGQVMAGQAPLAYSVGTMIELPRAALMAGSIAREAAFFSFGTNDLTQTTLGISRDDSGHFLPDYQRLGIFAHDPFSSIDIEGVGELVTLAAERGKAARADLKLGVCGEHGGDPASIQFFARAGLDYVSCSPWRVPIARLAAAQAALMLEDEDGGQGAR